MVGGSSEWISPAPYITAVAAPRTRPRSRACGSLCRRPIQTSAADPIANTASTAQCEGPNAENSRFAEISATTSVVWSPIAPTISAEITPQRRRQDCGYFACLARDEIRRDEIRESRNFVSVISQLARRYGGHG